MIKFILFDLGGVVVKWNNSWYYHYLAEKSGLAEEEVKRQVSPLIQRMDLGEPEKKIVPLIGSALGISEAAVDEPGFWFKHVKADPDMVKLVQKLKTEFRVGFLSDVSIERFKLLGKVIPGFDSLFEVGIASCNIGIMKPNLGIYEAVIRAAGVKPEEILFTDDLQKNVDGAKIAGINAVLFTDRESFLKDLNRITGGRKITH